MWANADTSRALFAGRIGLQFSGSDGRWIEDYPARKKHSLWKWCVFWCCWIDLRKNFGSIVLRSMIMTSPFPPNFNVGWDTHRCSRKGVFFSCGGHLPPERYFIRQHWIWGQGGRPENSHKCSAQVMKVQQSSSSRHHEECFFLAGWSHSNHFSSKTESLSFNSPSKQSMRQRLSVDKTDN